jgi:hypothetical protein
MDQYTMTLTSDSNDPQVVGYKTKVFSSGLAINKVSTNEFTFCKRKDVCANTINLVPLHAYTQKTLIFNKYYTTDFKEYGNGNYQWTYDGPIAYCFPGQEPNTIPLYKYLYTGKDMPGRNMYTTNYQEMGNGKDNWTYKGVSCYVYPTQESGTVPLYRQVNEIKAYALTTNTATPTIPPVPMGMMSMGPGNMPAFHAILALYQRIRQYKVEGVIGYASSKSAINRAISCCECE